MHTWDLFTIISYSCAGLMCFGVYCLIRFIYCLVDTYKRTIYVTETRIRRVEIIPHPVYLTQDEDVQIVVSTPLTLRVYFLVDDTMQNVRMYEVDIHIGDKLLVIYQTGRLSGKTYFRVLTGA